MEHRMLRAKRDEPARELQQVTVDVLPIEPRDLVVLTVRVVVPALRASNLVAAKQHRHTLRQKQRREEVALLTRTPRLDLWIVSATFRTQIPRSVVALAIAILFTVRVVVLFVVRHQIVQREPVVRGHEIDARPRPAALVLIEGGGAGN